MLVVAHHALIAYMGGLPKTVSFTKPPYAWGAFPVQDPHTFSPFGLIVGVNDIFFMSLMFFISGLFVWDGLKRKGAGGFLRDRIVRLGVPFAIAARPCSRPWPTTRPISRPAPTPPSAPTPRPGSA